MIKNIIYFTTAQERHDFDAYRNVWKAPINSSNQVFHRKFIRALSENYHVDVISLRPFSKSNCRIRRLDKAERITSKIHWHYLGIKRTRIFRYLSCWLQTEKLFFKFPKNTIIITDTINPRVLSLATSLSIQKHIPIFGVCTDSPSNITGTKRSYSLFVFKLATHLDGYVCLTESLNSLFNEKGKPSLIIAGLVEDYLPQPTNINYKNYIFYSGTLLDKFGITNLVNAFLEDNNPNIKLLIAGHHIDNELRAKIHRKPNIKFLGSLSNIDCLKYEQNALANINPRPFNEDLDRYSVPSKVLEYLRSGRPIISTNISALNDNFKNNIIWIKSNNEKDIIKALNKVYEMSEEDIKNLVLPGQQKSIELYSINSVSAKLKDFIESSISRDKH